MTGYGSGAPVPEEPFRSFQSSHGGGGASAYGSYRSSGTGVRMHHRLSQQENEIINVAFESFKDESGFITTKQLQEAFEKIDATSDLSDIRMLVDEIDEDGNGKIDETEFRHIMTKKFLGEDDDQSFIHGFAMLDENKDGFIPLVEFRNMLMREGQAPLSEQEVDELMMFADLNSDGLIDYRSFLRWLSNPDA